MRDSWRARGDKYPGLNRCTNLGRCWCQNAIPGLLRQCPFPPARRAAALTPKRGAASVVACDGYY